MPFTGAPAHIPEQDFIDAARALGCDVAGVKAVAEVESRGTGFLPDGRPVILYEAHIFDRLTHGKHRGKVDRDGVALSVPNWDRRLYGAAGAHQHARLEDAAKLDWNAAHGACSWGRFQIMGFNYPALGYESIGEFIEDMKAAAGQLEAFVRFVLTNGLDDELQRRDWAGFARGYNGPAYRENRYDEKMAEAYRRFTA